MSSFRLTNDAEADLFAIGRYTRRRWGPTQVRRYLRQLDERFQMLADHPAMGTPADEIRSGYRRYPEGQHVIFYRYVESGIEIVRVLHRRMLPEHHLLDN